MHKDPMDRPHLLSYMTLRKAIGGIGIALPIVLIIGDWLLPGEFPTIYDSISYYYHTVMRDVLVGSLCAAGVFLVTYKGYPESKDNLVSNLAGAGAIGVALFPTPGGSDPTTLQEFFGEDILGLFHVVGAATFFVSLGYMSIWLFTRTGGGLTARKRQRNRIYRSCGWTILVCIALIASLWFIPTNSSIKQLHPVLVLEAVAIWAFGISWLTKGEAILKDEDS
jgi:hypothetical protein